MSIQYLKEELDSQFYDICEAVGKLLRSFGTQGSLAAKVLSLLWITCGSNQECFTGVAKVLKYCIQNGDVEGRTSAIHALGMLGFIENTDEGTREELMNFLQEIINANEADENVLEACLDNFGLLYSKAPPQLNRKNFNQLLDTHLELLDSNQTAIRISAGENIALFLELHRFSIEEEGEHESESYYERFHELVMKLESLANG
jgi:hypothetical protein